MVTTVPAISALVEPAAPMWAQRMVLHFLDFFMPLQQRAPMQIWACKKAALPPASDYPFSLVIVSDIGELAISLGGTWMKVVTSGPV
jgi:hypothetical protein